MFRPHIGSCSKEGCGRTRVPIVVKDGWCDKCHYERKQAKKKAEGKKTGPYQYKREATGEAELFEQIAEERDWKCFVTGERLSCLTPTSFMHVLPKALNKYPLFKLYKPNIQLVKDEIHYRWDHTPRSELKEPYWQKLFDLEERLKEHYKLVRNNKNNEILH